MNPFYIYLILINAIGMLLMLADKSKAKKGAFRIPEKVLFGINFLGGSLGCTLGTYLFRHKTQKPAFAMGFPATLCLHILILAYWLHK